MILPFSLGNSEVNWFCRYYSLISFPLNLAFSSKIIRSFFEMPLERTDHLHHLPTSAVLFSIGLLLIVYFQQSHTKVWVVIELQCINVLEMVLFAKFSSLRRMNLWGLYISKVMLVQWAFPSISNATTVHCVCAWGRPHLSFLHSDDPPFWVDANEMNGVVGFVFPSLLGLKTVI